MKTNFDYKKVELCLNCQGEGYIIKERHKLECPVCRGSGRVVKRTRGTVEVEPYKADPYEYEHSVWLDPTFP